MIHAISFAIFNSFLSFRWFYCGCCCCFCCLFFIFHLRSFWALLLNCVRRLVRCLWHATATFAAPAAVVCYVVVRSNVQCVYWSFIMRTPSITMSCCSLSQWHFALFRFYFRWNRLRACVRALWILTLYCIMCVGKRAKSLLEQEKRKNNTGDYYHLCRWRRSSQWQP